MNRQPSTTQAVKPSRMLSVIDESQGPKSSQQLKVRCFICKGKRATHWSENKSEDIEHYE